MQWRGMKNTAKAKYAKEPQIEGIELVRFMEKLQKTSIPNGRSQRGAALAAMELIKKELPEIEEEPFSVLPTVLDNNHIDALEVTLDSTAEEQDIKPQRILKRPIKLKSQSIDESILNGTAEELNQSLNVKRKRQRRKMKVN